MRVAIDARIRHSSVGGVQQALLGLAHGLGSLPRQDDDFLFLVHAGESGWLEPFVQGPVDILESSSSARFRTIRSFVRRIDTVRHGYERLKSRSRRTLTCSDGTIESTGIDVMHFARQDAFITDVPSVYQPHDLLHRHLPEALHAAEVARRNVEYSEFASRAHTVVAMSSWGAQDLVNELHLPWQKVRIIPWASTLEVYASLNDEAVDPGDDDPPFLLYPAQTWPHKNHLGLLRALARLRDRGLRVPLRLTGSSTPHESVVRRAARDLRLDNQVTFRGFVSSSELLRLYRDCRAVVMPTFFEGWGMPVVESLRYGVPLACSNVTCLPDIAGDSAILFDPYDTEDMARAIERLWTNESLRRRLVAAGYERTRDLDWHFVARSYLAVYREVAGKHLDRTDRELLFAEPFA